MKISNILSFVGILAKVHSLPIIIDDDSQKIEDSPFETVAMPIPNDAARLSNFANSNDSNEDNDQEFDADAATAFVMILRNIQKQLISYTIKVHDDNIYDDIPLNGTFKINDIANVTLNQYCKDMSLPANNITDTIDQALQTDLQMILINKIVEPIAMDFEDNCYDIIRLAINNNNTMNFNQIRDITSFTSDLENLADKCDLVNLTDQAETYRNTSIELMKTINYTISKSNADLQAFRITI